MQNIETTEFGVIADLIHAHAQQDPARRALLVAITTVVRRQLIRALDVLGIEAPERM